MNDLSPSPRGMDLGRGKKELTKKSTEETQRITVSRIL
jgi:hypothetical protein